MTDHSLLCMNRLEVLGSAVQASAAQAKSRKESGAGIDAGQGMALQRCPHALDQSSQILSPAGR